MQQHAGTHTHTHTHTLIRPESTFPFNLVDIVLHLFPPYPKPGLTGSRETDVTLLPNALQEHRRHTRTKDASHRSPWC